MRIRYAMLALLLVGSVAFAETDYIALQKIEAIKKGVNTPDQIQDLRVQDDATIGDDLAVGGDAAVTGSATVGVDLIVSGLLIATEDTASLTNGQTLSVTATLNTLTGIGGADDSTNTITLANAEASGRIVILSAAIGTTNLLKVADAAPRYLAGDWIADEGDTLTLKSEGTNWVEVSRSNN